MRVEDLDQQRCSVEAAERQLADLAALGIEWEGETLWQSQRHAAYQAAVDQLAAQGLVYECYCSRREILEAPRAPHSPPGSYPGTCRDLTEGQRAAKRAQLATSDNPPASITAAGAGARVDGVGRVCGGWCPTRPSPALYRGGG